MPTINNSQGASSIIDGRIRGLQARKKLDAMGVKGGYMSLVDMQAMKEGVVLTPEQRVRCRQLLNGNLTSTDFPLLELVERAVATQEEAFK